MSTSTSLPTSLLSPTSSSSSSPSSPSLSPPAYSAYTAPGRLWKIKNAKYRSTFVKRDDLRIEDFREHVGYIKDPHFISAYGPNHIQLTCELPNLIQIQYSQVFCHLTELLNSFQNCISEMSPLQEEDLLFLLLRRFADSSDATVYAEIRRSEDVQIYDSTIQEPLESMIVEGSLSHDTSVIHADLHTNYAELQQEHLADEPAYTPLPQTPSEVDVTCAVTVNFPATMPIELSDGLNLCPDSPPEYTDSSEWTEILPEHDWTQLPAKFQPPSFRIHRCHHRGVERGGEDDAFELPLGFPEILQHMEETCDDVPYVTFRIHNQSRDSLPLREGGTQSFECDLFATIPSLYITVKRNESLLFYECFRNRKDWISSHSGHEECTGC
ncbi:uncharacterized protein EKO05_0005346 [Ascochyta rabiei]|uniref:uncharacterized protein n=1 Tax=Didymella rabiei TaxID=5454 RepID=UPI0022032ED3|nr:uncharacterized protein EKO05_0005346 [Ascochyta rabiei]UPX14875.1 hypothetical protein EKO05_0005346 [Ascochyta rabiei]